MRHSDAIRAYDFFKLVVLLVLAIVVISLLAAWQVAVANAPTIPLVVDSVTVDESNGDTAILGFGEPGTLLDIRGPDGSVWTTTLVEDNGEWVAILYALTDGDYELTVARSDGIGPSVAVIPFVIISRIVPTIDLNLELGEALNPGPYTLTGRGTPGVNLTISVNGSPVGEVLVDQNGQWSLPITLTGGDLLIEIQETGIDGVRVGVPAFATVGVIAPPTIDPLENVGAGTVTFTGTGTPGRVIELRANGQLVGSTGVAPNGRWVLTGELEEGGQELIAYLLGEQDAVVAVSSIQIVNATPGLAVTAPSGDLQAGLLTLTGTGVPGGSVAIWVNGEQQTTTTIAADGSWQAEVSLPAGEVEIEAQLLGSGGTVVSQTQPIGLTVAPSSGRAPALTVPSAGFVAGVNTLTGVGEPGTVVDVIVNGESLGVATVGADGNWVLPDVLLPAGDFNLQLRAPEVGAVTGPTHFLAGLPDIDLPTIDLPVGGLSAGRNTLSGTGSPGKVVAVIIDGQVVGTTTVGADGRWTLADVDLPEGDFDFQLYAPDAGLESPAARFSGGYPIAGVPGIGLPTLNAPESPAAGVLSLSGTGLPGTSVQIVINGEIVGTALVGPDGSWSFDTVIAEGENSVAVNALAPDGSISGAGNPLLINVAPAAGAATPTPTHTPAPTPTATPTPPGTPPPVGTCEGPPGRLEGDRYIVGPCDRLFDISRITGVSLADLLAANPEIRNPDLIYPGQVILIP